MSAPLIPCWRAPRHSSSTLAGPLGGGCHQPLAAPLIQWEEEERTQRSLQRRLANPTSGAST